MGIEVMPVVVEIRQQNGRVRQPVEPDSSWPKDVVDFVHREASYGKAAGAIRGLIWKDKKLMDELRADGVTTPPSVRTIYDWSIGYRPPKPKDVWTLEPNDPDGGVLLKCLADLIVTTKGEIRQITNAEASWLGEIREIAPDMPVVQALLLARYYVRLDERADPESQPQRQRLASDGLLAFAPWRSPEAGAAYIDAVEKGWIPKHDIFRYGSSRGSAGARGQNVAVLGSATRQNQSAASDPEGASPSR